MKKTDNKTLKRVMRHRRIRAKVKGDSERPRLAVFRSNRYCYAQVIDDAKAVTICSYSDLNLPKADRKAKPIAKAGLIGKMVAEAAVKAGIKSVIFDRGGFLYTGRVKALAEAARLAGLQF